MTSNLNYMSDLLDLIQKQEETIKIQDKIIIEVVSSNLEKENMINILLTESQRG